MNFIIKRRDILKKKTKNKKPKDKEKLKIIKSKFQICNKNQEKAKNFEKITKIIEEEKAERKKKF